MTNQQRLRGPMDRRRFLQGAGLGLAGAGASLLFGCGGDDDAATPTAGPDGKEPPPEVTRIRLPRNYNTCMAPIWIARDFLKEEGFTEIEYVTVASRAALTHQLIADQSLDVGISYSSAIIADLDRGLPLAALAGVHPTCFEIRARESVASIADLRGKRVAIMEGSSDIADADYAFVTSILQYIGLTVGRDVDLVAIAEGLANANYALTGSGHAGVPTDIFAILSVPPLAQQMRDAGIGRVILDSHADKPWSQYICCFVITSQAFVAKYPVATKRALRAILRAVDMCAREPERAAKQMLAGGWANVEIYTLETMRMLPYGAWRTYSVEDSIRFFSLRLREAGVIKSTPDEILRKGMDLRYLDELREKIAFAPGLGGGKFALNCDTPVLFGPPAEGLPS